MIRDYGNIFFKITFYGEINNVELINSNKRNFAYIYIIISDYYINIGIIFLHLPGQPRTNLYINLERRNNFLTDKNKILRFV